LMAVIGTIFNVATIGEYVAPQTISLWSNVAKSTAD
jgi:hypothetical protein